MADRFPDLTPRQLNAYREIQRIRMAWLVLGVLLAVVVALTASVLVLIFLERHWAASTASGVLDGIFGTGLIKIISFHWPGAKTSPEPALSPGQSQLTK
jgi:hypothetical protein